MSQAHRRIISQYLQKYANTGIGGGFPGEYTAPVSTDQWQTMQADQQRAQQTQALAERKQAIDSKLKKMDAQHKLNTAQTKVQAEDLATQEAQLKAQEAREKAEQLNQEQLPDQAQAQPSVQKMAALMQFISDKYPKAPEMEKQGEHRMNAKLQAGLERVLQKEASEARGDGLLTQAILKNADKYGLTKAAAQAQGVIQVSKSGPGTPSSVESDSMEGKNKDYGKGEVKLDDDPTKGSSAQSTGKTVNNSAGAHITTEECGMPDLSLKTATDRRSALRAVLEKVL